MSPRPFVLRLILPFAVMVLLIVVVCGTFMYWVGQRTVRLEQQREAEHLASNIESWGLGGDRDIPAAMRQRLRGAAGLVGARVSIVDAEGVEQFDAMPDGSIGGMNEPTLALRPEVIEARQRGTGMAVEFDPRSRQRTVHVAVQLRNAPGWVLRVSQPEETNRSLATPAWVALGAAGALSLVLVAIVAFLLQRQWVGPMRALAFDAEQMASGAWHVRAEPSGSDDIRFFSTRLNRVATQAEKQLTDLRQQRQDLQALVDTLPDPIIVTDAEQRITLLNVPASDLLQLAPAQVLGKRLVSVVTESSILDLYEQIRQKGVGADGLSNHTPDAPAARLRADDEIPGEEPGAAREIRVVRDGQRLTFQAVARRNLVGGVLLVLRNVSTMSAAVQMKTDFVANASHELRTPIAAIKIAFETLREVHSEDPVQTERCITIIDGHIRRLEEMLRDLLDLSRVESPDLKPHLTTVKADEIFATVRAALGPMARQKNLELTFVDRRQSSAPFYSDMRLLNLVLKNLVENSIKFTPPGGKVTVAFDQGTPESGGDADGSAVASPPVEIAPTDVRIAVSDTGIGIAAEHLDRVFERFYQADPARSGSAGRGTGLGLAIVKHAVAGLGGTVHLRSKLHAGTTITCVFPQPEGIDATSEEHENVQV